MVAEGGSTGRTSCDSAHGTGHAQLDSEAPRVHESGGLAADVVQELDVLLHEPLPQQVLVDISCEQGGQRREAEGMQVQPVLTRELGWTKATSARPHRPGWAGQP